MRRDFFRSWRGNEYGNLGDERNAKRRGNREMLKDFLNEKFVDSRIGTGKIELKPDGSAKRRHVPFAEHHESPQFRETFFRGCADCGKREKKRLRSRLPSPVFEQRFRARTRQRYGIQNRAFEKPDCDTGGE